MQKTIVAIIAGFFVQLLGLLLIHSVWLKQDYIDTATLWRPLPAQLARVWAMLLAVLIYVVGAVAIYRRGAESKPWVGQGVRFGILLALAVVVYSALSSWVILPVPHMLVVKWIVGETLLSVAFGLVIAVICQPKRATA